MHVPDLMVELNISDDGICVGVGCLLNINIRAAKTGREEYVQTVNSSSQSPLLYFPFHYGNITSKLAKVCFWTRNNVLHTWGNAFKCKYMKQTKILYENG